MSLKEKLFSIVCMMYEVSEGDLVGRNKKGTIGESRQIAVLVAYMEITKSKRIICGWFGRKKVHNISLLIERAYFRYETDRAFERRVNTAIDLFRQNEREFKIGK